jgi:O-antigen/teichoic acid export membrane protein
MTNLKKWSWIKIIFKSNSLQTLFFRLVGVVFIFLTTFIFTHKFSPAIVGVYDFTRSYLIVFGSLCMLASDQTILYLIGRHTNTKAAIKYIYTKMLLFVFVIYLLLNISVFFFLYFKIIPLDSVTNEVILKSNAVLIFYCIYLINTEIFRALNRTFFSETLRNIIKYIPLIIGFFLLSDSKNPLYIIDYFIYGFIFISLFSSIILYFSLKDKKEELEVNYNEETIKDIIKYSIPIAISTVSLYLLSSIDIFVIKYYEGSTNVAFYSVAVKVITVIAVAINAISLSVATEIAYNFTNKNFDELRKILKKSGQIIFYFSLISSLFLFLFCKPILCVFGKQYLASSTAFIILLAGNLIMSISGNTYIYLLMTNKGMIMVKLLLLSVLINLSLNLILIPRFGIEGAAIASITAIIFWNFLGAFYIFKIDKVNILFKP